MPSTIGILPHDFPFFEGKLKNLFLYFFISLFLYLFNYYFIFAN
jgi:hypothetical protein